MSGTYNFKIEGIKELERDMERAGKNIKPLMRKAMTASTATIKRTAKEGVPVFMGSTKRAIFDKVTSSVSSSVKGIVGVGTGAPYAIFVEKGRRAGKRPPIAPIKKWARIKLGNEGAAFAIASKIGRKGTKPQPFMLPALEKNKEKVRKYFEDVADAVVKILAGK